MQILHTRHQLPTHLTLLVRLRQFIEQQVLSGSQRFRYGLVVIKKLTVVPLLGSYCHVLLGIVSATGGRYNEAVNHYQTALDRNVGRQADLIYQMGLAYLGARDFQAAESCFRRILAPQSHWVYQRLGESLIHQERLLEAEKIVRQGLFSSPDATFLRNVLISCLQRQGRADEALDLMIAAAAAIPQGAGPLPVALPWYMLTTSIVSPSRAEELSAVVAKHPEATEAIIFLARMESLLGNYEAATKRLKRASALLWPEFYRQAGNNHTDSKPPAFIIIGQAKSASTALFQSLCTHPRVEAPLLKEPQFWSQHYEAGLDWYYSHFPPLAGNSGIISGEASVTYIYHPEAPSRISGELPHIKLIVMLRDPVNRAYSDYWMHVRMGNESRRWEDIVNKDLAAWPCCPLESDEYEKGGWLSTYLLQSAVLMHLKRWTMHFPREQMLILQNAELARDLPGTLGRVFGFLDLPPFMPKAVKRVNEGTYEPMDPAIELRLRDWFAPHQRALDDFLSAFQGDSA